MRCSISVPASSANLGPGFDAVGMALRLRLRAAIEPGRGFSVTFERTAEAPSHDGFTLAIVRAIRSVYRRLPAFRVRVHNDIPLGKGLGSSAAATVLGLTIAFLARKGKVDRRQLAALACELEGHPDNALAAILGNVVVAASSDGRAYVRLPAFNHLSAVVVIPDVALPTRQSRALLPERYDRSDVVFTAQRAALLGAALASGSYRHLQEAMCDRIHQPYRARRVPGMSEALAIRDRAIAGVALSGAGPSVIALVHKRHQHVAGKLEACFARAGVTARSLSMELCARGLLIGKVS